jgi:secretion/DNA translocation related TadE-like protein
VTRPALIGERGSVSLLALAAVGLSVVLCLGIARVGGAAVLQARADTAADAAALAGADALALGSGPSSALRSARAAALLNHARLVSCTCAGAEAEVVVQLGRAHGHARAVVDLSGEPRLGP